MWEVEILKISFQWKQKPTYCWIRLLHKQVPNIVSYEKKKEEKKKNF